jgi:predicted esterase
MATVFLATLGMGAALSMQRVQPGSGTKMHFTAEKIGVTLNEFVKIYEPLGPNKSTSWHTSGEAKPVGSLILLGPFGGKLSWTLRQWWYLHTDWDQSDQEWCQGACVFGDTDKAAVLTLRKNLRIVDTLGKIVLTGPSWAKGGHSWFEYADESVLAPVVASQDAAVAAVFQLIEAEYKIVGDYKRIAIVGMSQGAELALEVGIRFPHQLGMVLSQRGVLNPARLQGERADTAAMAGTPFIMTAGDSDNISPLSRYQQSCVALQHLRSPVYAKWFAGLDHPSFWKLEWNLLMKAYSLMLSTVPIQAQIAQLTTWSPCV